MGLLESSDVCRASVATAVIELLADIVGGVEPSPRPTTRPLDPFAYLEHDER